MSQVRNLRAMFEQKGDSSPPDRGSVEGQPTPTPPADSPRPLSRVRTSFVTVEKDGRVGLQRDTSSDSIPTLSRTISAGTEGDTAVPAAPQAGVSDEAAAKTEDARQVPVAQTPKRAPAPIPEETTPVTPAKAALPVASSKPAQAATPKPPPPAEVKVSAPTPVRSNKDQVGGLGSNTAINKTAQREKSPTPTPRKLFAKPTSNTESQATSDGPKKTFDLPASNEPKKALDPPANGAANRPANRAPNSSNGTANGTTKNASASAAVNPARAASSTSIPIRPKVVATVSNSGKEAQKTTATASAGKGAPKAISTAKANAKPSIKSPGFAVKTPTSPAKPLTPKFSTKTPDRKAQPTAEKTTATATPRATAGKSTFPSLTKKPPAIQTFPSNGIGFVKPKPKSPTRPVQLPSSLTTHTASSATKVNVPRQSLSRQSGNFLTLHQPVVRSPSRASVSTVGTTATAGPRTLRRQSSTISRPRPSIGPPPKQAARDHPLTMKEKEVDEGFLARMMRPTQSSASKTADKTQLSPPRKQPVATTRKTVARDNHAVPVVKMAPKAPTPVPAPPATVTALPAHTITPVKEKAPAAEAVVEITEEVKAAAVAPGNKAMPLGQAGADAFEDEIVPTVVETPAKDQEKRQDEISSGTTAEPIPKVSVEPVNGVDILEKEIPLVHAARTDEETAVADSDTAAVDASMDDSDIPEAGIEN